MPAADRIIRTYRYRLRTTATDRRRLTRRLREYRDLHNAVVQERESHFRARRACVYAMPDHGPSLYGHSTELTTFRLELLPDCPLRLARGALAQAHRSFDAFFRRLKASEKTTRPRFLGRYRHSTLEFSDCKGMRIRGDRLQAKGIGSLRMDLHRPLPDGNLKTWKLTENCGTWYVCLSFALEGPAERRPRGRSVGLDLGLQHLLADDVGGVVANPRFRAASAPVVRRQQRRLRWQRAKDGTPRRTMSQRGSKRRAKAVARLRRLHRRVANQRKTHARQLAARLVQANDLIVVEDLNVRGLARSRLSKAITDAGWSIVVQAVEDAAAGRCAVVKVNPRHTSQDCPGCGARRRKPLGQRWHRCPCGLVLPRDHASAIMIKLRGGLAPQAAERAQRGERAAGNTGRETAAVPARASGQPIEPGGTSSPTTQRATHRCFNGRSG